MLHYKGVQTQWWGEAVNTPVYLINRTPTSMHQDITPYELGFKVKPDMDHLRVFGSQGYAHIDHVKRTKLDAKSFKRIFLGYADNVKGYRVFDLDNQTIKVSRSVKLDEREVEGIYETERSDPKTIIHVIKDNDAASMPDTSNRPVVTEEPMEDVEEPTEDVEMEELAEDIVRVQQIEQLGPANNELAPYRHLPEEFTEDRIVFRQAADRRRQVDRPLFMLEDGSDSNVSVDSSIQPATKRPRIDEDGLIAEAVIAYAASFDDDMDTPTTY